MRLIVPVIVLAISVGCSSNWVVRGDAVPLRNCQSKLFYQDSDADGWGNGGANGAWVVTCDADATTGFTASNGRDCDDDDPNNTGAVGNICPENLAGTEGLYAGAESGSSEFMAILADDSEASEAAVATNYVAAATNCASWAGQIDSTPDADMATWEVNGHLATFSSSAQVDELQSLVESNLSAGADVAVYVGVMWAGSDPNDGSWEWVDEETDLVLNSAFSWCGGDEPVAGDFTPFLNPDDSTGYEVGEESTSPQAAALEEMEHVRLAMIFDGGSSEWCLGVPEEPQTASYLCERVIPDPADFVELATEEEIEAGESSTE